MYLNPESQRLLDDLRRSQERLIAHFGAGEAHRRGFRAVYQALESALGDMDEPRLLASVSRGWSPAEVVVHVTEHDEQIEDASRRGLEHMIEHGLEPARSLWLARMPSEAATSA